MNTLFAVVLLAFLAQTSGCLQETNGQKERTGAKEMEIDMYNKSEASIFARLDGEDLHEGFGALGAGGEAHMGFIPVKLGGAIEVQWQEGTLIAPTQKTILATAQLAGRQPAVTGLKFTYFGGGEWTLTDQDGVAQNTSQRE